MDRNTYYVSVQAGTVLRQQDAASYEFEIEATLAEAEELQRWMNRSITHNAENWIRAQLPGIPYHQDEVNDEADQHLQETYRRIERLGTELTKQQLARMRIN
ncbi:MAG: hypothetical protein RLZZ267_1015 [Bacillota bacterium]